MTTYRIAVLGLLFAVVSFVLATSAVADNKEQQLRRVMADLSLLNSQLSQRKADATQIRRALQEQLNTLKAKTRDGMQANAITAEAQALAHPPIYYNLLLMGEIEAYLERYQQKIGYFRVACDRLAYLYQQADDDLKIVNTLSGMKIDALVAQSDQLQQDYLPEAQTLLINPRLLSIQPPEAIWRKLESGW